MGGKRSRSTTVTNRRAQSTDSLREKYMPHRSVTELERYRPTRAWIEACGVIVDIINVTLQHTLGSSWSVIPQGSFVQGLQVAGSDLDLVLLDGTNRWFSMNRRKNADELDQVVRRLCGYRQQTMMRMNVIKKIYTARVPLARLRVNYGAHQVEVDMCFGDPTRGRCDHHVHRLISRTLELEHFCLAMKIFANRRGLTETHTGGLSCFAFVLLAIYFYQQFGGLCWENFFQGIISLRGKPRLSVSVETQSLVPRPSGAERDFLHVSVPCKPGENAARCLTLPVWNRLVFPELLRAADISKSIPNDKRNCFDYVVEQLLTRNDVKRRTAPLEVSESESSSEDDIEAKPWFEDPPAPKRRRSVPVEVSRSESSSENDLEAKPWFEYPAAPKRSRLDVVELEEYSSDDTIEEGPLYTRSGTGVSRAIQIHECDCCDYFSFKESDMLNHRFTAHGYPQQAAETVPEPPTPSKYRMPRNYNQRTHMYAATPTSVPRKQQKKMNMPPESDDDLW